MTRTIIYKTLPVVFLLSSLWGCKALQEPVRTENKIVPASFANKHDSTNLAQINWKEYFSDNHLIRLIDSALKRNQELNITLQEIEIRRNEVRARKGEYLPFVDAQAGASVEKEGRYTR